jgi:hypothetical protein
MKDFLIGLGAVLGGMIAFPIGVAAMIWVGWVVVSWALFVFKHVPLP